MKKIPLIAFVSDAEHLVLPPDDLHLFPHLEGRANWEIVVWDDPKVDWKKYDLAVVRATWDYPSKLNAFKNWLDRMETEGPSDARARKVVSLQEDAHHASL